MYLRHIQVFLERQLHVFIMQIDYIYISLLLPTYMDIIIIFGKLISYVTCES